MGSNTTPQDMNKFRILMIHGFATCGQRFQAKARPISDRITELLTPEILHEFPGGIEFLYPDAPIVLECPFGLGDTSGNDEDDQDKQNQSELGQDDRDPFSRGWWYGRDTVNAYKGLENSLSSVAEYIHGQPIHGVIAFSQGAALGGMIASMVDCRDNPARVAAIRAQGLPVDDYLHLPGQEPLRFFVGCGGYRGTLKYYGSLYEWPIRTPSCHTLASMDAVVEDFLTMGLARSFSSYELVHYYGSHFVPRDRATVEAIAHFVVKNSCRSVASHNIPAVDPPLSQSTNKNNNNGRNKTGQNSNKDRNISGQDYKPITTVTVWRRERKTLAIRYRRKQVVSPRRLISIVNNHTCPVL